MGETEISKRSYVGLGMSVVACSVVGNDAKKTDFYVDVQGGSAGALNNWRRTLQEIILRLGRKAKGQY